MTNVEQIRHAVEKNFDSLLSELREIVAVRSVSSSAEHTSEVDRSADLVAAMLEKRGCEVQVVQHGGKPAVLASKRSDSADAPTVLLYAHHDVQPVGDESKWTVTSPFEPKIVDGRMYGRGAADDGAGIIVHLGALDALTKLPVHVKLLIEGEEEVGSPSFAEVLENRSSELESDYIIVADSSNISPLEPALTTSLRGVVQAKVSVSIGNSALHSGMFGGPVLDAMTIAARIISSLHDGKGNVAIPGLAIAKLDPTHHDLGERDFVRSARLDSNYRLVGDGSLAERLWAKPSVDVIAIDAPSTGKASNTIHPKCEFILSMRISPTDTPEAAATALETHILNQNCFGASVSVHILEKGNPFESQNGPGTRAAIEALTEGFNAIPATIGVGGSIPFISQLQDKFPNAEVLVTGVEDPDCRAHAEDESVHLESLKRAIVSEALMLAKLSRIVHEA